MKNSNSFDLLLRRPSLIAEIDAERARRSLAEFVRQAWLIVEPSTPFVPGWHIDAIIEHLEAVSRGQIRNHQRSSAPHEEPARVGVLARLGVAQMARASVALQ